jgi:hypothetical protein
VFFGRIAANFLQEDKKLRFVKYFGQISTNFQKEGIISFFLSFQRLAILLDTPKNSFRKSGTIYPTEQRCIFLELAIYQQNFTPKL